MVEYLIVASSSATSSTTAACNWFSSRTGAEHPVPAGARQPLPLLDRDPQLLERFDQLGVDLVQALELGALLGRRVVADRLVVDGPVRHVRPVGLRHLEPVAVRLEPPLEHPLWLTLLGRNQPDDVLAQARRNDIGLDVGDEPVLVRLENLGFDPGAHDDSCGGAAVKVITYSQALQPLAMWARRSTAAPSTSRRNRSSAAHTSGKRSATARIAQLCSDSRNVPAASCHSAI